MQGRTYPRFWRWLAVVLAFAVAVPGCTVPLYHAAVPPPTLAAPIPSRASETLPGGFYYQPAGLADDFPEESTTFERIRQDFEVVRATGARHFRFAIGWDGVEIAPGEYKWGFWDELVRLASDYGITLLPYVCYTPAWLNADPVNYWRNPPDDLQRFGAFMYAIASRYKGKVASWELWNEPDNDYYWTGTAAQFAAMVREGARQVRRADPAAIVVLGGMAHGRSPFLEELLRQQQLGRDFDVVNVHGYFETWSPEPAEDYPQMLQAVHDLIAETAPHLDLWLAEFGYSDYRLDCASASEWVDIRYRYEHTPEYQAVALWKDHVLAAASGDVSLTTWYRIHDLPEAEGVIGDENNKHLGILDVNGDPKPAYYALPFLQPHFRSPFPGGFGGGRQTAGIAERGPRLRGKRRPLARHRLAAQPARGEAPGPGRLGEGPAGGNDLDPSAPLPPGPLADLPGERQTGPGRDSAGRRHSRGNPADRRDGVYRGDCAARVIRSRAI